MIQLILICVELITLLMILHYLKLLISTKDLIIKNISIMENDIIEYSLEIEKIKKINSSLEKKVQSMIEKNSNINYL